jgi:hypothetical protein
MNRYTIVAGAFVGLALAVLVINDSDAAPFNSVVTKRADSGFVTHFTVHRVQLADGGAELTFEAAMQLPESRSLPDGGARVTTINIESTRCALTGSARTAAENFATGAAATCVRSSNDLEQ